MTKDKGQRTSSPRIITFVTGPRAEFGLMRTVLHAIQSHKKLNLQLIATGMHLDPAHGSSLQSIRNEGWTINHIVPWPPVPDRTTNARFTNARNTGLATAALADAFAQLHSDLLLLVADRLQAFPAASA